MENGTAKSTLLVADIGRFTNFVQHLPGLGCRASATRVRNALLTLASYSGRTTRTRMLASLDRVSVRTPLFLWWVVLTGCSTRPQPISPSFRPAPVAIETTLLLIGDAGEPTDRDPVLAALEREVSTNAASTTVVFLGDNVYPDGLPDSTAPARRAMERRLDEQVTAAGKAGRYTSFLAITTGPPTAMAVGTPFYARAAISRRTASRACCRKTDAPDPPSLISARACGSYFSTRSGGCTTAPGQDPNRPAMRLPSLRFQTL